mmetsp:Transcript_7731/g.7153  ORF Transcript_7731/g.7153 Transcript_7731/m.7153 type:complete len:101 (-) Transcript_7731:33-335(-)
MDTSSENYEAILKLWRGKPSSSIDASRVYPLNENLIIEKKLDETVLSKVKLPLIGKKAVEEIKREDMMGENELNSSKIIIDSDKLLQKEEEWERHKEVTF